MLVLAGEVVRVFAMFSAPTSTAPACSSRAISTESRVAWGRSRLMALPARVGRPATSILSLTATMRPQSGRPRRPARSISSAWARNAASGTRVIQMAGSPVARSAVSAASAASMGPFVMAGSPNPERHEP